MLTNGDANFKFEKKYFPRNASGQRIALILPKLQYEHINNY